MFAVSTLFAAVHVHSTRDLSLLYDPDLRGAAGADWAPALPDAPQDSTIAWSMDGRFLYYASEATCQPKGCAIRKWSDGGRGAHVDLVVAPDRVTHVVPLPGGGIAFSTAGPAFGVVDATTCAFSTGIVRGSPGSGAARPTGGRSGGLRRR